MDEGNLNEVSLNAQQSYHANRIAEKVICVMATCSTLGHFHKQHYQ